MTTTDEAMESLLSTFDDIFLEFGNVTKELQLLRSNFNIELKKREALEVINSSLQAENERLKKQSMQYLNNLADQMEYRTRYQNLENELNMARDANLHEINDYKKSIEMLRRSHATRVNELESKIRGLQGEKLGHEATINKLHEDLARHRSHIDVLSRRLDQVSSEAESRHHYEIQGLKDYLLVEQEEKCELIQKLQQLEKELLISRTRSVEEDLGSNRHVESLKQKIMKLRTENEVLKRQLHHLKEP